MFITSNARYNIIRSKHRIQYDSYLTLHYDHADDAKKLERIIDSDREFKPFFFQASNNEEDTHFVELHFPRLSPLDESFPMLISLCKTHGLEEEKEAIKYEYKLFKNNKISAELNKEHKGINLSFILPHSAQMIGSYLEEANHYECAINDAENTLLIVPREHVKNRIDSIPDQALYGRRWCSYDSLEDLTQHLRDIHYKLWRQGSSEVALVKAIAALYLLEEVLEHGETGRVL